MNGIVTYREIVDAEAAIRGGVLETPCNYSEGLSAITDTELYCKS